MRELIERLKDEAGGYGDGPTVFTNDDIAALRSLLNEAAAALEAAREDADPIVRFNDDGTLDEVVGVGQFHLEQMGNDHWWMQLGPHMVNLSARGKIRAHFGKDEARFDAAIDQARGKGGG